MDRISELKQYAREHHVPIMQDEGITFICDYIRKHHSKHILEIGSAIGYSAICFTSVSQDVVVTTIERDDEMYQEALKNIQKSGLENRITIIHGDANEVIVEGKYDVIFIDAAKSQYQKFFEKYQENLKAEGVVITDNLSFHGMVEDISLPHNRNTRQLVRKIQSYIEFLKQNEQFDTTFYSLGDGISVSKRKIDEKN